MNKLAVDSTQTLRALTLPESQDTSQARWFVVQVVTSDRPINMDTMPRLEVFESYRLYTVAGRQDDRNLYALRLGFFSDDLSASTLCGYLKTFFTFPSVVRVSAAEHARFVKAAPSSNVSPARGANQSPAAPPALAVPAERQAAAVARRTSQPQRTISTGPQKLANRPKSLAAQLLDEAREVQMAKTGRHRVPQRSGSWISRLLGGSKS